jgi:hypothetical protein
MKYILFLLLFSTSPAPHVDTPTRKAKAVWTLKSSSSMEFTTPAACKINGQTILDSLDGTDTVTGVGWCFCESAPGGTCPADQESKDKMSSMMTSKSLTTQDFVQRRPDGSASQEVSVGAIKLLPKSLAEAQKAAEEKNRAKPNSTRR